MKVRIFSLETVIFLIGVAVAIFVYQKNLEFPATTDAQRCAILARNITLGRGYFLGGKPELIFPPGFSALLLPMIILGADNKTSVALLMSISMVVLGLVSYKIGRRRLSSWQALLFSTLILINGNTINLAVVGAIEIVWLAVLLSAFYVSESEKTWFNLLSGSLFGLAYLLKPETLGILVVSLLIYLAKERVFKKKICLILAGLFLVSMTYVFFLYQHTGKITFSGKIAVLVVEFPFLSREPLIYSLNKDGTVGPDLNHYTILNIDWPKRISVNVKDSVLSLYQLLLPIKLVVPVLLILLILNKKQITEFFFDSFLLLPLAGAILFHIEPRYYYLFLILTIYWLTKLSSDTLRRGGLPSLVGALGFIALGLMTYYSFWPVRHDWPILKAQRINIYVSLTKIPEAETILARKPYYSFYLNRNYYPLPYLDQTNIEWVQSYLDHFPKTLIVLDEDSKGLGMTNTILGKMQGGVKVINIVKE